MDAKPEHNDITLRLSVHFICAGTSALILSIAHIYPGCWFITLFALVPFLWRLKTVGLFDAIFLGVILAGCYGFIVFSDDIWISPRAFLIKLFLLTLILPAFGATIISIRKYMGLNPVFIAVLWLPVEYLLAPHAGLTQIFTLPRVRPGFVLRLGSLFGFLMLAFAIVAINLLILLFLDRACRKTSCDGEYDLSRYGPSFPQSQNIAIFRCWFYLLDPRAPPI